MSARSPVRAKRGGLKVEVLRLPHGDGLPMPAYQSAGAAGLDLLAAVPDAQPIVLPPGGRVLVPTGLVIAVPAGHEAQIRPRSGLALKHGVTVLNSPGTIDSDYRGEIQVLLVNLSTQSFEVRRGERIAQMVFAAVALAKLVPAAKLKQTQRGAGGFGSTGTAAASDRSAVKQKVRKKSNAAGGAKPGGKGKTAARRRSPST